LAWLNHRWRLRLTQTHILEALQCWSTLIFPLQKSADLETSRTFTPPCSQAVPSCSATAPAHMWSALYRRRCDMCTGRCCSVLNAARTLRRVTSRCSFPSGKRYGRRPRSAVEVKATVVQWFRRVLGALPGWGIHRLVLSGRPPQRIWKLFLTICTPSLLAEIVQ
jgi:hypothetical protein